MKNFGPRQKYRKQYYSHFYLTRLLSFSLKRNKRYQLIAKALHSPLFLLSLVNPEEMCV